MNAVALSQGGDTLTQENPEIQRKQSKGTPPQPVPPPRNKVNVPNWGSATVFPHCYTPWTENEPPGIKRRGLPFSVPPLRGNAFFIKNLPNQKNLYNPTNLFIILIETMAKGKTSYQIGKSQSGLSWYVYPVQKKNLPAGEKLKLMKYDKKLRKHVEFTFKDVK